MTDSPFPPGSSLCAYLRDSGGARQSLSVDQQEREITQWCEARGYRLTHVYKDVAASAKAGTVGREAFAEMQAYFAERRQETGLLLWDLSRWARDLRSGLRTFLELEERGVRIYTISEAIPEGPFGLVYVLLKFMSTQDENTRKSADVARGLRRLAADHHAYPAGKYAPPGYRRVPVDIGQHRNGQPHIVSRLEPDPATAPLVRLAYQMAAAGHSLPEIRQATGLHASTSGVARMLAHRLYSTGEYRYGGLVIPQFAEPLVAPEIWQAAQIARQKAIEMRPRSASSKYLLSGMLTCGRCGGPLCGHITHGHRRYLCVRPPRTWDGGICGSGRLIDADHLESRVLARLREALENPALLAALHAQQIQAKPVDDYQDRIEGKRAELRLLSDKVARAVDALIDRPKSPALLARLDELEAAQAKAQTELAQLEAARPPDPLALADLEQLRLALLHRMGGADFRMLQLLLRSLECRATITRDYSRRDACAYTGRVSFTLGVNLVADLP